MKKKMFSVWDEKAGAFLQPFFALTKDMAMRGFAMALEQAGSEMCRFPGDFTLFELGEFDDSDGSVKSSPPVSVVYGGALKAQLEKE